MAADCGTIDSNRIDYDILGTSGLVVYCQDYLYGNYLLYSCLGYTCVNIPYGTLCGAMTQNIENVLKSIHFDLSAQ